MPFFVRRPVVVEARQVTVETLEDVAKWCSGTIVKIPDEPSGIRVMTVEGERVAFENDWLIQEAAGLNWFYPCPDGLFSSVFEEVGVTDAA